METHGFFLWYRSKTYFPRVSAINLFKHIHFMIVSGILVEVQEDFTAVTRLINQIVYNSTEDLI